MNNHTAKQFVRQLGSLISLYLSLAFFLTLVFGLVNVLFPDNLESYWQVDSAMSSIRLGFAMTIVFFPAYLLLTRTVNQQRRTSTDGTYLDLTKWLIYLSLLVGGAVLLGDLVAIIMGWLEGELTNRFLFKAMTVLVVTGAAFYYYVKDAQGYWVAHERQSTWYGLAAATVIGLVLAFALMQVDTPTEVRERKADQQQLTDLRQLQWAIDDHLRAEGQLTTSLEALYKDRTVPEAPAGRPAYQYKQTDAGFALCATFAHAERTTDAVRPARAVIDHEATTPYVINPDDWYYEAGEWCFNREVKYPE